MFVTLNYHIINRAISDDIAITEEAFEQQLAYLHEHGYTALSLDQAIADLDGGWQAPQRAVLVTFDDGYADTLHVALPRLQAYGMRATLFIITGYIGQSNRWNTRACYDTQHRRRTARRAPSPTPMDASTRLLLTWYALITSLPSLLTAGRGMLAPIATPSTG